MKQNMGTADRLVRLIIAVTIAALWFRDIITGTAGVIALAIACIFFLTSVVGNCPLYSLFGIRTCAVKKPVKH